jgi:hypothetical protein
VEAAAAVPAEPAPPEGLSESAIVNGLVSALGEDKALAFWKWLKADWPTWARGNWNRLSAVHAACSS